MQKGILSYTLKQKKELFSDNFGDNPESIKWRCFIVVNSKDMGVGAISAQRNSNFRGQEDERIHRFAIRGAGIGYRRHNNVGIFTLRMYTLR
jgi:hypothetical protein